MQACIYDEEIFFLVLESFFHDLFEQSRWTLDLPLLPIRHQTDFLISYFFTFFIFGFFIFILGTQNIKYKWPNWLPCLLKIRQSRLICSPPRSILAFHAAILDSLIPLATSSSASSNHRLTRNRFSIPPATP